MLPNLHGWNDAAYELNLDYQVSVYHALTLVFPQANLDEARGYDLLNDYYMHTNRDEIFASRMADIHARTKPERLAEIAKTYYATAGLSLYRAGFIDLPVEEVVADLKRLRAEKRSGKA